jgi:hypothetical protein
MSGLLIVHEKLTSGLDSDDKFVFACYYLQPNLNNPTDAWFVASVNPSQSVYAQPLAGLGDDCIWRFIDSPRSPIRPFPQSLHLRVKFEVSVYLRC